MKTILFVFGTRPEAIKLAPLIIECRKYPNKLRSVVAVTGQHREMLDQVLQLFDIHVDYDLNLMKEGQDLFDITSKVLTGLKKVMQEVSPDYVIVHGDTTTSFAAALSAFYLKIKVAHVEAGLRTNNKYSPWPEELNRQMTSRIAVLNFAPTEQNRLNLIQENIDKDAIFVTGNTGIDALFQMKQKYDSDINIKKGVMKALEDYGIPQNNIIQWESKERRMILVTGHRRENMGVGFNNMLKAIKHLSINYPMIDFVFPMHPNPVVRKSISEVFNSTSSQSKERNVFFTEPIEYLPFVYLMSNCFLVLTDSGGIQEEAPSFNKPVLVTRDTTERQEALDAGTIKLVGTDFEVIVKQVEDLINNNESYLQMANSINPFGDGAASLKIVSHFLHIDNQ